MSASHGQTYAHTIRGQRPDDIAAIDDLMVASFGAARHGRSVRHLRLCEPVSDLCFVAEDEGMLVGSIRYWPILVAGKQQLLLGPLAVNPDFKGRGHGKALVAHSLAIASQMPFDFVLISGEPDYYPRFGFEPARADIYLWPGFIEPERLQIKYFNKPASPLQGAQAILPIIS